MKPRRFSLVSVSSLQILALLCAAIPAWAQSSFYLQQNDRVVFYGDSITQQGQYNGFVETYLLTHFPNLNVRFINAGWSGDWIVGGGGGTADERLARDVVANRPTVATFMLGMNDAAYQDFDTAFFDVYTKGYSHLVESLRQSLPDLRIILFQPSPFDDITRPPEYALHDGGYNKVIVRYGEFVRQLAQQHGLAVVDMNAPLVAALEKARSIDPKLAEKIIPDRIHPSAAGGLIMAAELLKAWNAPAVVSAVEIDAAHARVMRSENTLVTGLHKKPGLSWMQADSALPLPLDPEDNALGLAVRSSDVVAVLDQQTLQITGLKDARYSLRIDGEEIGSWAKEDLAHGINLAPLPTPMLKQALAVHALTARHNAIRLAQWQGVQVALQNENSPHVSEALKALDALEDELLQQQRATALPQAHRFELVPQMGDSAK